MSTGNMQQHNIIINDTIIYALSLHYIRAIIMGCCGENELNSIKGIYIFLVDFN